MMKLAIFDIDGTLLQTNQVDGACYAQALKETVGGDQGWDHCSHMTDSCIFGELFESKHNRLPEADEVQNFIDLFVRLLQEAYHKNPQHIVETPGAQKVLEMLAERSDWAVAIATGGWRKSAEFKLQCANVPFDTIPFSTANDGISREDILTDAFSKTKVQCGVAEFSKMVSIGDAPWDYHTAVNLNMPLIGVGDRLVDYDVSCVVQDFEDTRGFLQLLEQA